MSIPTGRYVNTTAQLHSMKPEFRFCAGSNPACGMSEIRNGKNLWQSSRLEIRLNPFRRSTTPQKQFNSSSSNTVWMGTTHLEDKKKQQKKQKKKKMRRKRTDYRIWWFRWWCWSQRKFTSCFPREWTRFFFRGRIWKWQGGQSLDYILYFWSHMVCITSAV